MEVQKLASLLRTRSTSKSWRTGKVAHQKVISLGLQNNIFLCKNIINFYISCNLFDSARLVFQSIENPLDITLWNGLLAAHSKNRYYREALQLFWNLQQFHYLRPDEYTYPSVIKACGGLCDAREGRNLHAQVIKLGIGFDVVVGSSLVGMYAKCSLFESAVHMFEEMPERDVACWNTVMSCYYQDGQPEKALRVYEDMKCSGFEPDSVSFTTAASACARLSNLMTGKEIHEELMQSRFASDTFANSAIVDMYGKCGCLETAKEVFEQMPQKSVVSWNSLIGGYASKGDSNSCLELFLRMIKEGMRPTSTTLSSMLIACSRSVNLLHGKSIHGYIIRNKSETDIFVDSSLLDLYLKCGSITPATQLFQKMPKTNAVAWNVMISGCSAIGWHSEALEIYNDMKKAGISPDAVTFTSILPICSQLAAIEKGKEIHDCIIANKFDSNEMVMAALMDMYAKSGSVDDARQVFSKLPDRDFVSWTSMITAYGSHGRATEALELFHEMQKSGAEPDSVTYLAVITACSHAGFVDEGLHYFNLMIDNGIAPKLEHYSCLIDLLGRARKLNEAYSIIKNNPAIHSDIGILSSFFASCKMHRNLKLGEEVGKLLIEKDPDDPSTYIVLSNMYACLQKWDKVSQIRATMKERRLRKNPGCSWVEIDMKVHSFYVEDKSHPASELVYDCLQSLAHQMEREEEDSEEEYRPFSSP